MLNVNPLLQLNTFIHMALDYPDNSNVYPYLNKRGYLIKFISQGIVVPKDSKVKVEKITKSKINHTVEPEMILQHKNERDLLLLECKVNGFEINFDHRNTKQALGYLCCGNNHVQGFLGVKSVEELQETTCETKLLYAVSNKDLELQESTFLTLSDIVTRAGVDCVETILIGMDLEENDIHLTILENGNKERIKVIDGGTSNLLYILPIDPGVDKKNPKHLKMLEQKVILALRLILGKNIGFKDFEVSTEFVYRKAIPIWDFWSVQSQKHVKPLIKKYIKEAFQRLNDRGLTYEFDADKQLYRVGKVDKRIATKIRGYLLSDEFVDLGKEIFEDNQLSFEDVYHSIDFTVDENIV